MPREKLLQYGVESLSNEELLALLLQTGTKEEPVLNFAKRILEELDGLDNMLDMSVEDWCKIKGIKSGKASKLIGFIELAKRIFSYQKTIVYLRSDEEVYNLVKYDYYGKKNEELMVLYVNSKCMLIRKMVLSIGSINSTYVDIKQIVNYAIKFNANGLFLIHNHPSGDMKPSKNDLSMTQQVESACKLFNINLLDHLIIGNNEYFSFYKNMLI